MMPYICFRAFDTFVQMPVCHGLMLVEQPDWLLLHADKTGFA